MLPEKLAYNRLETDEEFRHRIVARSGIEFRTGGARLDDDAWRYFKMQRRIIFVPAP